MNTEKIKPEPAQLTVTFGAIYIIDSYTKIKSK